MVVAFNDFALVRFSETGNSVAASLGESFPRGFFVGRPWTKAECVRVVSPAPVASLCEDVLKDKDLYMSNENSPMAFLCEHVLRDEELCKSDERCVRLRFVSQSRKDSCARRYCTLNFGT